MTQCQKIYDYIASHPGCTSLEMINAVGVINNTARISEINNIGIWQNLIICEKEGKYFKYRLSLTAPKTYNELIKPKFTID